MRVQISANFYPGAYQANTLGDVVREGVESWTEPLVPSIIATSGLI